MRDKFVIMTIKNVFAFTLDDISYLRLDPKKIGDYEKRIEVFLDETLVQVTTFYFVNVKALR